VAGVTRGHRQALKRILELLAARAGSAPIRASVMHADAIEEAEWMAQEVKKRFNCLEFFISEFTPVMGAHTGPGVIGVAFCQEDRPTKNSGQAISEKEEDA